MIQANSREKEAIFGIGIEDERNWSWIRRVRRRIGKKAYI
jgi:hypothetical protein